MCIRDRRIGDRTNSNFTVMGMPGKGKSFSVKSILLGEWMRGTRTVSYTHRMLKLPDTDIDMTNVADWDTTCPKCKEDIGKCYAYGIDVYKRQVLLS